MPASQAPRIRQGFLVPTWKHWLLASAALVGLLASVNLAAPSNALRVWYWMRVVGPSQQSRYGFQAALDKGGYGLRIVSVTEGGAFHAAGVRPGWVSRQFTCFGYSQAELLFVSLRDPGNSTRVALRFATGEPADNGVPRWVLVSVPPGPFKPAA